MMIPRSQSKTVIKAMQLVDSLASARTDLGVSDLARQLGFQKSVVHALLNTLVATGMVEQDQESRLYRLGLGAFRLGQAVRRRLTVRSAAIRIMTELAGDLGESVHLVIPNENLGICVEEVVPVSQVRLTFEPGLSGPLHVGASCKAILAFMPLDQIERYLTTTVTNRTDLRADLKTIRERGYAISHGEMCPGATALAAPVFNDRYEVIASISVAGLSAKFTPALESAATRVIEAGQQVSAAMGCPRIPAYAVGG